MNKELILKLRYIALCADRADVREAVGQAADALEAKSALVGDGRGHDIKGSRKALGAMNAKLKAKIGRLERELASYQRQQAREVVMPERQEPDDEWHYVMRERSHGWNACLDEFARLNKGAGSHE